MYGTGNFLLNFKNNLNIRIKKPKSITGGADAIVYRMAGFCVDTHRYCKSILGQEITCSNRSFEIFDHFFVLKDSIWPHMNRQKRFSETSRFRGDIRSQSSKIGCPRSQRLRRHPMFFIRYGDFHIFKLLLSKYLFLPDCSLQICEKPSKFSKSVHVVVDYADTVTT